MMTGKTEYLCGVFRLIEAVHCHVKLGEQFRSRMQSLRYDFLADLQPIDNEDHEETNTGCSH